MRFVPVIAALALGAGAPCTAQQPPKPPAKAQAPRIDVQKLVRDQLESILKAANDGLPLAAAASQMQHLFDKVAAYAPDYPGALAEAAFGQRLTLQLSRLPEESRLPLLADLTKHQDLARALVMLAGPRDTPKDYYGVLEKLIAEFGDRPGELPALTAALCVVHDRPIFAEATPPDEPRAKREQMDAAEVFRFFSSNEKQMVVGLKRLPPELAVYLVDGTAKIEEMEWALRRHKGDRNIGKQYDTIVYDTAHFKYNKPKKIEAFPYTLENIRKVGGVCAEQAYYVAHCGKAVGVPAVSITGRSTTMAHAWAGVLHLRGKSFEWSLEEGCFGEYRKLRGSLTDPQTRERISSAELHLLAELMNQPERERHTAIAYADAAHRLVLLDKRNVPWPPPPLEGFETVTPHAGNIPGAMQFLEQAVKAAPTSTAVWGGLAPMTTHMTPDQRTRWSEALFKACEASPDFCYRIMGVMIDGLEDAASQAQVWGWVSEKWHRRPDLVANALMAQGGCLERAEDKDGAFACYERVWQRLINDAPQAVDAIGRAEKLLKASGRENAIVGIYADAFRRIDRPDATSVFAFIQSSYYLVGERYAQWLDKAGRGGDARTVRNQLKAGMPRE